MPSDRTRVSLAQFLALLPTATAILLLHKHGYRINVTVGRELFDLHNAIRDLGDSPACLAVLDEVVRTNGDLRSQVNPRNRFTERYEDLTRCLRLDGYRIDGKALTALDPSILDSPAIEDDLISGLRGCNLEHADEIIGKLNDSAESFRRTPPDYNACLANSRVAMEALARDAAAGLFKGGDQDYDPTKWGSILVHLRNRGLLSVEGERGLAGVYAFLSPGAHRPIGLSEEESCRLGRSLALSMCWYLLRRFQAAQ